MEHSLYVDTSGRIFMSIRKPGIIIHKILLTGIKGNGTIKIFDRGSRSSLTVLNVVNICGNSEIIFNEEEGQLTKITLNRDFILHFSKDLIPCSCNIIYDLSISCKECTLCLFMKDVTLFNSNELFCTKHEKVILKYNLFKSTHPMAEVIKAPEWCE